MVFVAENGVTDERDSMSVVARVIAPVVVIVMLGACSTVTDVWDGTTDIVGSLFSSDEDEIADVTESGFPDLAAVPAETPSRGSASERAAATEGLIADRNQAQYTEQVRRREPVAVRPLQEGSAQATSARDGPPPPVAAPVGQVTQVDTAPRTRPSLAERLGVAPPPPPPVLAASVPRPVPSVPIGASAQVPSSAIATTVIGGDSLVPSAGSAQAGSSPNALASYDASAYRVSTHIVTISFVTGSSKLTASDRRALDDVIKLRAEYNGAIRVVGHASSRTRDLDPLTHKLANFRVSLNRANSVAAALMSKGLSADRLFVGAVSDNEPLYSEVMPAGESGNQRAEIYIDY